mmetsp:Transcript_73574/g.213094  ORF Transcript_73574/g.213094 Transcript_73574/m.213094 type:complete len:260 (-) Transcript_73574:924-1703(-)
MAHGGLLPRVLAQGRGRHARRGAAGDELFAQVDAAPAQARGHPGLVRTAPDAVAGERDRRRLFARERQARRSCPNAPYLLLGGQWLAAHRANLQTVRHRQGQQDRGRTGRAGENDGVQVRSAWGSILYPNALGLARPLQGHRLGVLCAGFVVPEVVEGGFRSLHQPRHWEVLVRRLDVVLLRPDPEEIGRALVRQPGRGVADENGRALLVLERQGLVRRDLQEPALQAPPLRNIGFGGCREEHDRQVEDEVRRAVYIQA